MEATFEEMSGIVEKHRMMCPECGVCEASFDAFTSWYDIVKDRNSGVTCDGNPVPIGSFDVNSLLGMFDQDLREYAKCEICNS